jgi:hypothetical protein
MMTMMKENRLLFHRVPVLLIFLQRKKREEQGERKECGEEE